LLVVDNNHHFGTSVPGAGAIHPICFRNGPLFVKSSEWYLAAGLVLPFVVDSVAAT
jgi:hypothetical protein